MLNQFKHLSSQSVNCSKTEVFMAGVNEEIKQEIVIELDFKEGKLPVRYLGIH